MKIALIGATGYVGSRVLREALSRGHDVTAIVRHTEKLPVHPKLKPVQADIKQPEDMIKKLKGHDLIITTVYYTEPDLLLEEIKKSGVPRYIAMGGTGSLEVSPGQQFVDAPDFPEIYLAVGRSTRDYYEKLKKEEDLNWTVVVPSLDLVPGERTGNYRIGHDNMLVNEEGRSTISVEDLAHAMLDEIEHPKHIRKRFTVGY
jgi:putative NADH-flavin reductase